MNSIHNMPTGHQDGLPYERIEERDRADNYENLDQEALVPYESSKDEFSYVEYSCFFIIGMAMMWTW